MPPRFQTLPPAQTSSAREALQSFYCQLCQKGYSRMNDYEAHLSSYDHSHKQRLKDMKAMVRDPNAAARARRAEAKADGVISIKLGDTASGGGGRGTTNSGGGGGGFKKGGFKKSGFKSSFVSSDAAAAPDANVAAAPGPGAASVAETERAETGAGHLPRASGGLTNETAESDTEDEGYEMYDPRFPTE